MRDDNDRLREGTLPDDAFADAVPIAETAAEERDSDVLQYKPFPVAALPEPVCSFVTEAASAIGCDPAYVALGVLAGLAASIGNTRRIKLKGSWCEPSVFWTATVGESGTWKSPALDVALAPLHRLQGKAIDEYRIEKKAYDEEIERYIQAKRSRKRTPTEEELTRPDPPIPWRILCSDVTVEALASLLQNSPRGLLLVRDELSGWIKGFDQYKSAQGADAAHFLSMHRAGDLLVDRKTNSEIVYVRHAAVSVTGGIQPRVLKRVLGEEHLDNGLAARLLLAMPPRLPKRWTDEEISLSTATRFSDLYSSLLELDFEVDEEGDKKPADLALTVSGKGAWVRFYNQHGLEQARRDGDLAAAFSKLEGYCARFALVIHLIRCQNGDPTLETEEAIDSGSIEAGVALTTWFAHETERVYSALGIAPAAPSLPSLEEIIRRRGGRISVRELMQASRRYRGSAEMARAALEQLAEMGLGRWVQPHTGRAGRPSEVFEITEEGGNAGNGNGTQAAGGGAPGCDPETAAPYDVRPTETGSREAGNTTPGSVTGEEVLSP
jgi:hypothetical protein